MSLGIAMDGEALELAIYEDIVDSFVADWGYGVCSDHVRRALAAYPAAPTVNVRLNCLGGDVFEGSAIYSLLTQSRAKVRVFVDGVAASAASIIAMAGDEIIISAPATMMVHEAWTMARGDAAELRASADRLDMHNAAMAKVYAERTGQSEERVRELMRATTWLDAGKAVELGFATQVAEPKRAPKAQASARHRDIAAYGYRNVPEHVLATFKTKPPEQGEQHERSQGLSALAQFKAPRTAIAAL